MASNGTCDSVRRVIAYSGFGFQVGHLFILFFFIVFDYSQPVWMLAEMRLGNNCSLIIAKCERKVLLDGRDSKMSGSITANIPKTLSITKVQFTFKHIQNTCY